MIALNLLAASLVTTDSRHYHPTSSLRDSKSALLCCVASSFPLLVCALPRFPPGGPPLSAQPIFSSVGGILPSSCISPNLYCLLLEIFCLLGICCLRFFVFCGNRIGASDDEASVATTTPVVGVTALPQCHSKLKRPPCVRDAAPVP